MIRFTILGLALALPLTAQAQDAKKLAREVLDQGAALFDARNAANLSASYTEDARLFLVSKDKDKGKYEITTKEGRSEIEGFYSDLFGGADPNEKTTSRNTVEFARLVEPDLLVIHGFFEPTTAKPDKCPFVQVRVKKGDRWLIQSLRLFAVSRD
jgi:ketosteroid isomerase-like protein